MILKSTKNILINYNHGLIRIFYSIISIVSVDFNNFVKIVLTWWLSDVINDQPQVVNLSPYVLLECTFCDSAPNEERLVCNSTILVDKVLI